MKILFILKILSKRLLEMIKIYKKKLKILKMKLKKMKIINQNINPITMNKKTKSLEKRMKN
jgi:hypothetical protein